MKNLNKKKIWGLGCGDWRFGYKGAWVSFLYPNPQPILIIFFTIFQKNFGAKNFLDQIFLYFPFISFSTFKIKLLKNWSEDQMIFLDIWYLRGLYKIFREYTLYRSPLVFEIQRGPKWPKILFILEKLCQV